MLRKKGPLALPRLGQVGIVVKDLEKTAGFYEGVFGIGPWSVFEGETERCIDRGEEVVLEARLGFAPSGSVDFELIEIFSGKTIHLDILGERDEGIHHLGFFVKDFEERLEACRRSGIGILQQGKLKQLGLEIDYAYLDTVETGGVIFELIQWKFLGIKMMPNSRFMRLVTRLGSGLAPRLSRLGLM